MDQGRAEIDRLIAAGELQRVPPNREHADLPAAAEIVEICAGILDEMSPF